MTDRIPSRITKIPVPVQRNRPQARRGDFAVPGLPPAGGGGLSGADAGEVQVLARQLMAEFGRGKIIAGRLASPVGSGRKSPVLEIAAEGENPPGARPGLTARRRIVNAVESGAGSRRGNPPAKTAPRGDRLNRLA